MGRPRGRFRQPLQEVRGGLERDGRQLHRPPRQPRGQPQQRPPRSLPGRLALRLPGDLSRDRGKNKHPPSLGPSVTDTLRDAGEDWRSLGWVKRTPAYLDEGSSCCELAQGALQAGFPLPFLWCVALAAQEASPSSWAASIFQQINPQVDKVQF